jgi:ATP-binding cassette, subfamily B (MDR/TAP), member 1
MAAVTSNLDPIGDGKISSKDDPIVNTKADSDISSKSEKQETIPPMAAYFKLWSFATPLDVFLRIIAAFAAAGGGTAEPLMAIIFGNLVNLFDANPPRSPEDFRSEINKNALYFVYLFIGKFAVSLPRTNCLQVTDSDLI